MSKEHWALLAGFMGVVSIQLVGMGDTWESIKSPLFWGTTIGQIAILIRSAYVNRNGHS